jgi:hypothetical protein
MGVSKEGGSKTIVGASTARMVETSRSTEHSPYVIAALVHVEARRSRSSRSMLRGEPRGIVPWAGGVGERGRGGGGCQGQRFDRDAGPAAVGAGARHGAKAGGVVGSGHCHRLQSSNPRGNKGTGTVQWATAIPRSIRSLPRYYVLVVVARCCFSVLSPSSTGGARESQ